MAQRSIIPVAGYREPSEKEGYRSIQYDVDLTSLSAKVELTDVVQKGNISRVVTMYYDNADNTFPITVVCNATQQRMIFRPGSQGYVRLLLANLPQLLFTSPTPCVFAVSFLNFYVRELTWDVQAVSGPFVPLAGGTMTGPLIMAGTTIVPDTVRGIVGTTLGDNAQAGSNGEFISSTVLVAGAVAAPFGAVTNIQSIILTAGDWDVTLGAGFTGNGAENVTLLAACIHTTAVALSNLPGSQVQQPFPGGQLVFGVQDYMAATGPRRINVAVTTTIFHNAFLNGAGGAPKAFGIIRARRIR